MPAYRSAGILAHRYEKDDDCLYKQVRANYNFETNKIL